MEKEAELEFAKERECIKHERDTQSYQSILREIKLQKEHIQKLSQKNEKS